MGIKIGLQLYSVRESMGWNPIDTLDYAMKIGYKYLEFANLNAGIDPGCGFGVKCRDMQALLQKNEANVVSSHFMPLNEGNIDRILEYHSKLGTKYLNAKLDHPITCGEDGIKLAESYNRLGEKLKTYGMRFCYYPRFCDYTYEVENGRTLLDIVMEHTIADLVDLEIDIYWLYCWGNDSVEYIKKYSDRIKLAHQKDIPAHMQEQVEELRAKTKDKKAMNKLLLDIYYNYTSVITPEQFTEVGTGIMDIQQYIDALNEYTKAEYLFLEQDYSEHDKLESIKISMDVFKKYNGIQWN